jgi:hypothetical protein
MVTGCIDAPAHLILAHGAGAPMTSPFLCRVAELTASKGVTVHRFDFPYMAERATGGSRRPAPRAETLVRDYFSAIAECRTRIGDGPRLFIGGKSMGGRVACLAAAVATPANQISGVIVLGYPLTPPRRPGLQRGRAIESLDLPTLILQGTRDSFGGRDAFGRLAIPDAVQLRWIEDGDHDLKPRRLARLSPESALEEATSAIAQFCAAA